MGKIMKIIMLFPDRFSGIRMMDRGDGGGIFGMLRSRETLTLFDQRSRKLHFERVGKY